MTLPVKKMMLPWGNRNHPKAYLNDGDLYILVHETGNQNPGTGARMHAVFVYNGGGDASVSFHLTVDEVEAYQMMGLNLVGWHAGDGCDSRTADWGCFRSVAIETCVNDGNRHKDVTRRNLAKLIAMILSGDPAIDFGGVDPKRFSVDRIKQHRDTSGKWCPTTMLNENYHPILISQVRSLLGSTPAPVSSIVVGDYVELTEDMNIRTQPDLKVTAWNGKPNVISVLPAGTKGRVIGGPTNADGHTWFNLEITGFGTGFVALVGLKEIAPPPPAVTYAKPVVIPELAALKKDDKNVAATLVLKNGIDFVIVWDQVEAIRQTRIRQFAYENAPSIQADAVKGDRRWVSVIFKADDKRYYYYDDVAGRLLAEDWKRVQD